MSTLYPILLKIDFSNVNFDGYNAQDSIKNFEGFFGVKITPQTIHNKDLHGVVCKGVEFIGSFDGVNVMGTNFRGSKGAIIDPQTIKFKSLFGTICENVKFVGHFDGVILDKTMGLNDFDIEISNFESKFEEKTKKLVK